MVIGAVKGDQPGSAELLEAGRAGTIDVAFAWRLRDELKTVTLEELADQIGASPSMLGSTWRLGYSQLGVDTFLGGGVDDVSTPTLDGIGKLKGLDSDHLEAHRRAGRDVFVTSDIAQLKAARERGFDAATPEELIARLRASSEGFAR